MKYFKYSEFDQKGVPGSGAAHMDRAFLELMEALREKVGFPMIINSGWRSPEYNAKVSSTGLTGPHTTGKSCDVRVYGQRALIVLKAALELGFTGIGISQKGPQESRFIHLDTLANGEQGAPRPWVWSY